MNYSAYEEILLGELCFVVAISGFSIIFGLSWIIYCLSRPKKEKDFEWYKIFLLSAGMLLGGIIGGGRTVTDLFYDIDNRAYIVWQGDFVVEEYARNQRFLYIPDENGIQLVINNEWLDPGAYMGVVIYSEKTEIVVEAKVQ